MNPIEEANNELSEVEEEPLSLEEYIGEVRENASLASHSVKYILEAIEECGTREVIEKGEELERCRFFDDPYGDGEHAVLGHTKVLNEFVDELRRMASEEGENEKILWVEGPTATGKSEFKRCMINGIRGYSQSEEGKRYTLEWNLQPLNSSAGLTYGDIESTDGGDWYRSPINVHPLSVLPSSSRESVVEDINSDSDFPTKVDSDIDPFSREAYNYLKDNYKEEDIDNLFSNITSREHLRVCRYTTEVGDGIGVLHSEDTGNPKEKLVGHWMQGAMEEFASRGRKNAQAFSYDGVVGQGNSCLSIIEDARHHLDVLQKLLNVVEEKTVKLDNKIGMDIDTLFLVISNPDLEGELRQFSQEKEQDPLRALRRRMDKYEFSYLISPSLETQLIRRMLGGTDEVWEEVGEEAIEKMREPIEVYGTEFAPHTIETAAIYEVITRVPSSTSDDLGPIDKSLAFDRGYHKENNKRWELDQLDYEELFDGEQGVPVTFTVDILVELAQDNDIVMPNDVVKEMKRNFREDTLFDENESKTFENEGLEARRYLDNRIEEDVLEAMVGDERPDEDKIREYVDSVFAWDENDEENFEHIRLAEFEKANFGTTDSDYDENHIPKDFIVDFRAEKIIDPINSYIWNNKDEDFEGEMPISECPTFDSVLGEYIWDDVERNYPNFKPASWRNPAPGSETEELKQKTINNMVEDMGYSEESAERATVHAIEKVRGV